MPDFVITASIYVDNVEDAEQATETVERVNNQINGAGLELFIRLPDPPTHPRDTTWEEIDHPEEEEDKAEGK